MPAKGLEYEFCLLLLFGCQYFDQIHARKQPLFETGCQILCRRLNELRELDSFGWSYLALCMQKWDDTATDLSGRGLIRNHPR